MMMIKRLNEMRLKVIVVIMEVRLEELMMPMFLLMVMEEVGKQIHA